MRFSAVRASVVYSNNEQHQLLLIGENPQVLTNLFVDYIDTVQLSPVNLSARIIAEHATASEIHALIRFADFDDTVVLIADENTSNRMRKDLLSSEILVMFSSYLESGLYTSDSLELSLAAIVGETSNKGKSPWKNRREQEPPKSGDRFYAIDSRSGRILYTVHWNGEEFMTDYESWSGLFDKWTYAIPHPRDFAS